MNNSENIQVPLIVKIAITFTIFNSWVLFEETVIDCFGWSKYLPFYKIGYFCTYDFLAILVIVVGVWFHFRQPREGVILDNNNINCFLKITRCLFCN